MLYLSTNLLTAQRLSETKDATVAELRRVSSQRDALLPEPAIVSRTHLKELSRTSWITCDVEGRGPGWGTTEYQRTCYLTRYIYLDPGPGPTKAEELDWAAGGYISHYGCHQSISLRAVNESISIYAADCPRVPTPRDAMAIEGQTPGLGIPVVTIGSSYYFMFSLGCRPFSLICDEPVSEPIRI